MTPIKDLTITRNRKREIKRQIGALQKEYRDITASEKGIKASRKKSGHCCAQPSCYNLTSKKTVLGKLDQHYRQCDEHRAKAKLRIK